MLRNHLYKIQFNYNLFIQLKMSDHSNNNKNKSHWYKNLSIHYWHYDLHPHFKFVLENWNQLYTILNSAVCAQSLCVGLNNDSSQLPKCINWNSTNHQIDNNNSIWEKNTHSGCVSKVLGFQRQTLHILNQHPPNYYHQTLRSAVKK